MHEFLKKARVSMGYTQNQIADVLKIKYQQYQRYETGKFDMPISLYVVLADFYGVSLDYLCGRDEARNQQDGSDVS